MAKSPNQKLKLVYLMEILQDKTDENHPMTMHEIISRLAEYDISAERKSIYNDIETLKQYGMDIIFQKETPSGYYVGERYFELPELKLLVDAVQSSKFITYKKSKDLIKKIESLTSIFDAKHLQRQVFVSNRIKTMNESIYYNVDMIHSAISANTKIKFQYFEWTLDKEMKLKKEGDFYIISPWALTWDDENYYMIGYDEEASMIKHYRVDKMIKIDVISEKRMGQEEFENFDLVSYGNKTFGMFGGKDEDVTIMFANHLIGVVIDRFGKDITIRKTENDCFLIRVKVAVSNQFFAWLSGFGMGVKVVSPENVVEQYKQHMKQILSKYE
ncbi:helix-turn-helix transcriptional regulator [Anaerosacchariphilus polymeriproducens]|uniref:WYL domain-containing protein n=1 Tax=Anaerosacchariphilus polymeriproducens TaxID=1812858 RepID=A0A371AV58_9FIRM|nr:WYL domain-containing protein [Anaerosacchariphilus polymeriproducens]RDU23431.1 WYL domain-containing protein [Anaerosacchariphilus polymeriproducens]